MLDWHGIVFDQQASLWNDQKPMFTSFGRVILFSPFPSPLDYTSEPTCSFNYINIKEHDSVNDNRLWLLSSQVLSELHSLL